MLTLFEGGLNTRLHDAFCERIKKKVEGGASGFLIVPEQQTVTAEAEACRILPPSSVLSFEVTNFTRFTNTAFRKLGGLGNEYCDSAVRSLLMWRVLDGVKDSLNMTQGRKEVSSGHVERALNAVGELKALGIEPSLFENELITPASVGRRLYEKAQDIRSIYKLYTEALSESYSDASDDCTTLAKSLTEDDSFIKDAEVFIDGFTSFTEPQYKLIRALIASCNVTVTLSLPKDDRLRTSYEYYELRDTEARLKRMAMDMRCWGGTERCDDRAPEKNEILGKVSELIFSSSDKMSDEDAIKAQSCVRIIGAETPFAESDFVAQDIRRRVTEEGLRYRDFAIVARRAEDYVGILDNSLTKSKVPHFISKSRSLDSFEAIKFIYAAYAAIDKGFRREDVIGYAKCGLCGLDRDKVDELELYCEKWSISGKRFTEDEPWGMNPKGLERHTKDTVSRLEAINASRDAIIAPLKRLDEATRQKMTVEEHARALYEFLTDANLFELLKARAKKLASLNETDAAEENARLYDIICDSLDKLVDVLGETVTDRRAFINQLSVVFSSVGLGRIPANQDAVTVGSADMLRLSGKKHIYLIGVNASVFPASVKDNSYFTVKDKCRLKSMGIEIPDDNEIKNAKELYYFQRAFSFADESVTLSWCAKDASFNGMRPASVIERLEAMTLIELPEGEKPKEGEPTSRLHTVRVTDIPVEERIYSPEVAADMRAELTPESFEDVKTALEQVGYELNPLISEMDAANTELKLTDLSLGQIYKTDTPIKLSQTKIDKFKSCPMSYFCTYLLRLKPTEKAEFNHISAGIFMHSILENFFKDAAKNRLDLSKVSEDTILDMINKTSEKFVQETLGNGQSTSSSELAIKRLNKVALPIVKHACGEFTATGFKPVYFELPIGEKKRGAKDDGEERIEAIIIEADDGTKAIIEGTIDRVDALKSGKDVLVRVMDYKTGSATIDRSKISEGESLQMPLYLKALKDSKHLFASDNESAVIKVDEGGKVIAAGMVYIRCDVNEPKISRDSEVLALAEINKNQTRDGLVMQDENALSAVHPEYLPKDTPGKRYSENEWDAISKDVENAVKDILGKLKSGEAKTTPCNKCDFCGFGPICRNQKKNRF